MRTLEVDFPNRAHFNVLQQIGSVRTSGDLETIAAQNGGSIRPVEGTVSGLEKFLPQNPATSRDKVELRVIDEDGAEVEHIHPNRNTNFPPSIARLTRPGHHYPVLIGDPTGDRMVVSKAFVVVE